MLCMMKPWVVVCLCACLVCARAELRSPVVLAKNTTSQVVLVTGATGRTGSLLYNALKAQGVDVRGLVRNATKARERLRCNKCDPSEGIFVGDITQPADLTAPMVGVDKLVILTSSYPLQYPNGTWYYAPGGSPKEVDFEGQNNQVIAALKAGAKQALLVSSMGTTEPDSYLDLLGNGHVSFYKLNAEASLMGSGMPFTIIKPSGLVDDSGNQRRLLVGHNDDLVPSQMMTVPRADVARTLLHAVTLEEEHSAGLRFDLSSDPAGPATEDFAALFKEARSWGGQTRPSGRGKHSGARCISFHIASHAFVPWCARCNTEGVYHDATACPLADEECTAKRVERAREADELAGEFHALYDGEDDQRFAR
ncbi:hypothetical protein CYMTET_45923 [Cymbomonas tetramitiformis]|uniref:NAD(P)-binding domain-containing protein n=1 Tax=Cymbomonas tetramitiformis TaxID=36881 RepID=A0AAE0EY37_9CHLO|nr:hypothetical protein CYMTET_45923 [Cymbomonas tetramitiformis]